MNIIFVYFLSFLQLWTFYEDPYSCISSYCVAIALYDDHFPWPSFFFVFMKPLWRPFSWASFYFVFMKPLWWPFSSFLFLFRLHKLSMKTIFLELLPFSSSWTLYGYHFPRSSFFFVFMKPLWRPFLSFLFLFRIHKLSMKTIFLELLPFSSSWIVYDDHFPRTSSFFVFMNPL